MAEWTTRTVGSLCSKITSGGTPSRRHPEYYGTPGDGIAWLKTKELNDGFLHSSEEYISSLGLKNSAAKVLPEGTVLMAMYGATVGKLGILGLPMSCNQAFCAMTVDPEVADNRFLFYRLLHDRQELVGLANGAAQQNLSARVIREFKIPCPPLPVQRRIAAVLGALDDLIESNERLALASGLFAQKTWDFAFADQEHNTRVADIGTVVLGGTPSRRETRYWGGSIPWLNSGKANDFRVIEPSEFITEAGLKASSTKYMPKGTTLIAITGATLGQVSRTEMAVCGNQSLVGLYADPPAVNDYLFCAVVDGIDRLTRSATGGAQQHINKGDVEDLLIAMPSLSEIEEWHGTAAPLLETSGSLLVEARLLRQTRDELLPLLMSGRVSPGEVDSGVRVGVGAVRH